MGAVQIPDLIASAAPMSFRMTQLMEEAGAARDELARCRRSLEEGIATRARSMFVRDAEVAYIEAVFRVLGEIDDTAPAVLAKMSFAVDPQWRADVANAVMH